MFQQKHLHAQLHVKKKRQRTDEENQVFDSYWGCPFEEIKLKKPLGWKVECLHEPQRRLTDCTYPSAQILDEFQLNCVQILVFYNYNES